MLFQKNIVKKYIGLLDEELITKGWLNLFMYAIIEKFLQRYENSHSLRHEWERYSENVQIFWQHLTVLLSERDEDLA